MKYVKRDCGISIELAPQLAGFLRITFNFGGKTHIAFASANMGCQFNHFLDALYNLYSEESEHTHTFREQKRECFVSFDDENGEKPYTEYTVTFDEEGTFFQISLRRAGIHKRINMDEPDPIIVTITESGMEEVKYSYVIDGRDLCYATAKACTDILKKYGFRGYAEESAGGDFNIPDAFDLNELLFIKAYALDAMEVRNRKAVYSEIKYLTNGKSWLWESKGSSFMDEIELLIADM